MDIRLPLNDQLTMLGAALKGRLVLPGHADYDALRMVTLANYDHRPAALIRVADADDVATVVTHARATGLELAIRSGGHSTVGGSGCNGGLVIDLRDLNAIEIDTEAQTAWVGTGLTAGEVTHEVEQHGLIVGFGDSGTVGIGGLTLGGGIGYLARKHGLTIDSLLAAEIVTAESETLIVDADNHPDLFWALRGGGGNFGVVTRVKFQLHPLPDFTAGPLILPLEADVLADFAALADAAPEALSTIAVAMPLPPAPFVPADMHGKLALIGMMAFAGAADEAQRALAPFRALATPIADLVRPAPYSSLYMLDPPPEMRSAVSIRSRFVDAFSRADAAKVIAALEACDAPMKMAQVRVLGGAFARVPVDATAFAPRGSRAMVAFLAMHAGTPEMIRGYDLWAQAALSAVAPATAPAYVNFLADEGAAGLAAAYPAETWTRLRAIKRRYDPRNMFHLNQNIPPAA